MTTEPRQHTESQYQAMRLRVRQLIRLFREQGYTYDEIEVQLLTALESEMEMEGMTAIRALNDPTSTPRVTGSQ